MKILVLIAFSFALVFAGEKYGVYNPQGNRVSTFEVSSHDELLDKTRQIQATQPNKNLYISSLQKGKASKPSSHYRYKAETGAYIDASRKETFSVCPDKKITGTWISEHSVALNAENCLSVQVPNLAGTFRILFMENSGRADTIQVLVNQSYIQMGDYSHKVWVQDDPLPHFCTNVNICKASEYGRYENKKYDQPLIVDKTELTMGDAWHYSDFGVKINDPRKPEPDKVIGGFVILTVKSLSGGEGESIRFEKSYPPSENLRVSMRPYLDAYDVWGFANMRSKLEGLDTAYVRVPDGKGNSRLTLDTSSSGYRMPYKDEWGMLMRAGASTRYYWGDEEDSLTVSRYAWVHPLGYTQYKVAQKQPNAFGLYDMISPNNTVCADGDLCYGSYNYQKPECYFLYYKIARRVEREGPDFITLYINGKEQKGSPYVNTYKAISFRLLRKTPKLHKLEKF
ncbi:MAG: formylglycine-generating enzyme family protein [Fibromonadaceae bacterium]|jgi:hypothetical protein|nr:formylglycine-generating enzyme family protein [Fibromonadaceae bacterium]